MADDDPNAKLPILMNAAGAKKLETKLRQKFKGSGGIQVFESPDGGTVNIVLRAIQRPRGSDGTRGLFPIIVKQAGGTDGDLSTIAAWEYDLYALADTGYANKLNATGGARQPKRSAARMVEGKVTQAADGSVGMAYYDADGDIQLWDCIETRTKFNCTTPASP